MRMNKTAYKVEGDRLLYDNSHPLDARNVSVVVPEGSAGTLKRGQVMDFDSAKEKFSVHAAGGTASCILAEDATYAEDDTEVIAAVYMSGTFRKSACITDEELTEADGEVLRSKGIYLK